MIAIKIGMGGKPTYGIASRFILNPIIGVET